MKIVNVLRVNLLQGQGQGTKKKGSQILQSKNGNEWGTIMISRILYLHEKFDRGVYAMQTRTRRTTTCCHERRYVISRLTRRVSITKNLTLFRQNKMIKVNRIN